MPETLDPTEPPRAERADAIGSARCGHPVPSPSQPQRVRAESLFAGRNEIEIQHGEAIYRLRITSLGKLILTK